MPRPCFPPAPLPPMRPTFLSPPCAAPSSSPPCAAATLPPFARLSPVRAALPRRYAGPSLRFASLGGWPPPLRPRPRRSRGWARPAPGAGLPRPAVTPSASTAGLRVELARRRSLACASGVALGGHAGLCPAGKAARVKIGGVLRGVLPRSSALRASGGGARGDAVRGSPPRAQPRLRSALGLRPRLRASFKSAETADFQRRLSVRAFPDHFSGSFRRFGGYKCPPRLHFTQKMA